MKITKKIGLGLIVLFTLLPSAVAINDKVSAASATAKNVQECIDSVSFRDIAHIVCNVGGKQIVFHDSNPTDANPDPAKCSAGGGLLGGDCSYNLNYVPSNTSLFCNPGGTSQGVVPISSGLYYGWGITVRPVGNLSSGRPLQLSDAGTKISLEFNLGYTDPSTGKCIRYPNGGGNGINADTSKTAGIANLLQFYNAGQGTGSGVESLSDTTSKNNSLGNLTYVLLTGASGGTAGGGAGAVYTRGFSSGTCSGDILLATMNAGSVSVTRYTLSGKSADLSRYPDLLAFLATENTSDCGINSGDTNFGMGDGQFSIYGNPPSINTSGQVCTGAACSASNGSGSVNQTYGDSCSLKSNGLSLAWIMCPALEAMDAAGTTLMKTFESQLPFCLDNSGVTCSQVTKKGQSPTSNGTAQIKASWAILKNLASALLVIIMLVMIFSQAVGTGPFDAYTVRKLLPRLAAATILIQFSWPLFAFIVDIVNDIGNGLAALLYAPFGGESQLSFGSLLARAGVGSGKSFFLGWMGGLLGLTLTVAFLPTVLFGATVAILTLLTGLAVLFFRKILIIMLVMVSPIALVLWILPGGGPQKYWKMWQDNFLKSLMMYPLIVTIIAAGRIFAYSVGAFNNGTGSGFENFWFVIAGYFLPLFILPKAYKWGGSIMTAAGNQITSLQSKAQSAYREPLKTWARENMTDKWANNYNPLKKTFGSTRLASAIQSVKGGRVIPTKAQKAKMLHRGQQWSSTMAERNDALRNNFVRKVQELGLSAEEVNKYDKMAQEKFGQREWDKENKRWVSGLFNNDELENGMRPNAVGSGKKASQLLAMDATNRSLLGISRKDDGELLKSIGRYNVDAKSLLEMADKNFVFPQMDPVTKKFKMVPFWDWRPLVDQAFKDPHLWGELGSMRPDLTPNNVPRGGARYQKVLALAGIRRGRDINGREFDVSEKVISENPAEERYAEEFTNPDGTLDYRPYLMQKMQALHEDTQGIIQKGGNTLLTFANEISGWNEGDGYYGEGRSRLPAEEFAQFILEKATTEGGLHQISNLMSTDSHVQAIDKALKASGSTQFRGADGQMHDLDVKTIFEVQENAFKKQTGSDWVPEKAELGPAPPPPPPPHNRDRPASGGDFAPGEPIPDYDPTASNVSRGPAAEAAPQPRPETAPAAEAPAAPAAAPTAASSSAPGPASSATTAGPTARRTSTTTGELTWQPFGNAHSAPGSASEGGPTRPSPEAEQLRLAAEEITRASREMRRAATAQTQVARRLGPIANQPPAAAPRPGDTVEPESSHPEEPGES